MKSSVEAAFIQLVRVVLLVVVTHFSTFSMYSALKEEHIALEFVPLVEELLADLLQVVHGGEGEVGDHPQS